MNDELLAALCDATAIDETIYFNDDKVEHGRAILDNLEKAGYTVVDINAVHDAYDEGASDLLYKHFGGTLPG